ncbi:MAG TPA: DUF4261 domain-containing protein [Pirellulales bacterium]|jgi:hypothetical protein|nr:DUF4261 domain-containing protein [Pirellulales bacterium]
MAKGMFTQGVGLLTDGQTTIEDLKSALEQHGYAIVKEMPAQDNLSLGGPALVVGFLPDVNGYASVDVVNQPWPDGMGDPKSDPNTFAAWSMGFFGPLAFPGSLARAKEHAWSWQAARTVSDRHQGFVRVRLSYAFGASANLTVFPKDYDPLGEMMFLSRLAVALLAAPGVLCYFNPNGEVLRDLPGFRKLWDACNEQGQIPMPLWMNIRFYNLSARLGFMDTVGNGQLEAKDIEAIFPKDKYNPVDIDVYLRNVTHYLLDFDGELKTGEAIDGPGENGLSWTVDVLDAGVVEPPRRVIRLYPNADCDAVCEALGRTERPSPSPESSN